MSKTIVTNTNNQMHATTDLSKIFLRNIRSQTGTLENLDYNPLTLSAGTLMARRSGDGKLVPFFALGAEGSQYPVGVLMHDVSMAEGATALTVTICDFGDVAESKILFYYAGQTLDTVVSSRRVRDWLQAQGIKVISATEMTKTDNA